MLCWQSYGEIGCQGQGAQEVGYAHIARRRMVAFDWWLRMAHFYGS
jgi:hypothetical protein